MALVAAGLTLLPAPAPIEAVHAVPHLGQAEVWRPLRAMGLWHEWTDTFRVDVPVVGNSEQERAGVPVEGSLLSIRTFWRPHGLGALLPSTASPERLTVADEASFRMCWRVEMLPAVLLDTDRCFVLTKLATGTEVVNRIQFLGLLGPVVHAIMGGAVHANFEAFNSHLAAAAQGAKRN